MINNEIIEYNTRQIKLMEKRVLLYKNNNIGIKKFIYDIDALIAWIQEKPETWGRELKGLLWEIEIIYAWSLAQQKNFLVKSCKKLMNISIKSKI